MKNDKIDSALFEAIYILRWNENKTALSAVLKVDEAEKIVEDIKTELSKINHSIVDNNYIKELESYKKQYLELNGK